MADTTQAAVLKIAPELSSATADQWTVALADAAILISEDNIVDTAYQELTQRFKVAHDLTILLDEDKTGSFITSQEMGDARRDYGQTVSGNEYDRTSYGTIFKKYWFKIRKMRIV